MKFIIVALATLAAVFAATPVNAQAHRISCVAPWDAAFRRTPGVFEVDWEGQTCNFGIKAKARCVDRFGNEKTAYSGIVTRNELEDAAVCDTGHTVLLEGLVNFRESTNPVIWLGWCEVWPVFRNCHT